MGAQYSPRLLQVPVIMMIKIALLCSLAALLSTVTAEEAQERHGGWGGGSYGGSHGGYNGGSNNWCLSTCGCSGTAATTTTTTAFPPRVGGSRILGGLADRFWGWGGWGGSSWGNWESDWCTMKCGCSGTATTTTTTTTVSTFPPRNGA